ncbi:AfsR/SARP family transcriptional regulator [Streptomyces sp. NPDC050619]|uniref:AfsR/SARP family transcriptional regulator n=1 Tax=Streptomyces sp. NPDC050619 TaxID=3157214 RepID=UPI0034236044
MRFNMLGPLEVISGGQPIGLGGIKQRATLGYLLLQPNQVVSTSQLLGALWSVEEAPATARKILQNAIWGLRRALAADDDPVRPAVLKTKAPGYCLQVAPERIDLRQFHQRVSEGRARLAAEPEEAARLLRDALALWRGPALSDLVEAGVLWPELTTVQDARLGVQEDYVEAQLMSGQHYAVLSELEVMVENEPLRERSCGQLMRALYRCGRQADALGVYRRLRAALVEDLGLEPSRELQRLQQAILTHDPSLQVPEPAAAVTVSSRTVPFAVQPEPSPVSRTPVRGTQAGPGSWERRKVAVLLVRAEPGPVPETADVHDMAAAFDTRAALIRQETERFGGVFTMGMDGVGFGLFPAGPRQENHAERAVRAAVAVRDTLAVAPGASIHEAVAAGEIGVRAVVATGEALVRMGQDGTAPLFVNGSLLPECQALLSLVPPGEVWVCGNTRAATKNLFGYLKGTGPRDTWQVRSATVGESGPGDPHAGQGSGHPGEVELLTGLLDHARRWRSPHQVLVLGASETARARVFADFRDRVGGDAPDSAQVIHLGGPRPVGDGPYPLHRVILAAYCGLSENDPPRVVRAKLEEAVWLLAPEPDQANRLMSGLGPFLDAAARSAHRLPDTVEWLDAWHQLVAAAAHVRPLVLINEAAQRGGVALQEFLATLRQSGTLMPLLVVTGARPETAFSRQHWPGTGHPVTTIMLDAPSDADTALRRLTDQQRSLTLGPVATAI